MGDEVKISSEELQWWHGRVNELELKLRSKNVEYEAKCKDLREIREKMKIDKKSQNLMNTQLVRDKNIQKDLEDTINSMSTKFAELNKKYSQSEDERKCILRTLSKIREQLDTEKKKNDQHNTALYLASKQKTQDELKKQGLVSSVQNYSQLQNLMQQALNEEKSKREILKHQVREKLEKVRDEQLLWRDQIENHERIVEQWKKKWENEKNEKEKLLEEKNKAITHQNEFQIQYSIVMEQRGDLLAQLRDSRLELQEFKKYASMIEEELVYYKRKIKEENRKICYEHLSKLDNKLEQKRNPSDISTTLQQTHETNQISNPISNQNSTQNLEQILKHTSKQNINQRFMYSESELDFDTTSKSDVKSSAMKQINIEKKNIDENKNKNIESLYTYDDDKNINTEHKFSLIATNNINHIKNNQSDIQLHNNFNTQRLTAKVPNVINAFGNTKSFIINGKNNKLKQEIIEPSVFKKNPIQIVRTNEQIISDKVSETSYNVNNNENNEGETEELQNQISDSCSTVYSNIRNVGKLNYDLYTKTYLDKVGSLIHHFDQGESENENQATKKSVLEINKNRNGAWVRPEHINYFKQ